MVDPAVLLGRCRPAGRGPCGLGYLVQVEAEASDASNAVSQPLVTARRAILGCGGSLEPVAGRQVVGVLRGHVLRRAAVLGVRRHAGLGSRPTPASAARTPA